MGFKKIANISNDDVHIVPLDDPQVRKIQSSLSKIKNLKSSSK